MLGTIVALVLSFFLIILIVSGIMSSAKNDHNENISSNSILQLKLDYPIKERSNNNPFSMLHLGDFSLSTEPGLNDILAEIHKAKTDENIQGIYMELSAIPTGIATLEEIRNALIDFKTSGKFIYSYGNSLSQTAYYLASASDKIFLHPEGGIDWKGIKAEIMFYKGTLAKLEVEPQIIRHGKFKSAIEPYILDKMSPENKEQIASFVGSIWQQLMSNISRSRNIPVTRLQALADSLAGEDPQQCLRNRMVDDLLYKDQVLTLLRNKIKIGEKEKINFVSLRKYAHAVEKKTKKEFIKDRIAVVYAYGAIDEGKDDNSINSEKISETLRKARLDEHVKAVVLRINSPGGSALASDIIWREVELTKKVKPVVASFGDYAASGGYYIACAATKIISQPNTITGSIGVFGVLFNAQKLINNKLGITIDTFKTARMADYGTVWRAMTASERNVIQREIEHIYNGFVGKVSAGRNLSKAFVDSIGQGRVWSAVDAKRLGLVDAFGGVQTAIDEAARLAHISKYRTMDLPEQKEPLQRLFEGLSEDAKVFFMSSEMKESYPMYQKINSVLNQRGIQARMPFDIDIY